MTSRRALIPLLCLAFLGGAITDRLHLPRHLYEWRAHWRLSHLHLSLPTIPVRVNGMTTIAPNNTAWVNSPGNWLITSTLAASGDMGARRDIQFTGTSAALTFNVSSLQNNQIDPSKWPVILYYVDGNPDEAIIGQNVSLATGLTAGTHTLSYEFRRGDYTQDVYTGAVMAVEETGLVLDDGATVSAPTSLPTDLSIFFGDSITAGLAMLSPGSGAVSVDAHSTYGKVAAGILNTQLGQIGKGGVGWEVAGNGNVPKFQTEWQNHFGGVPRVFPSGVKRVVCNIGTNDGLFGTASDATIQGDVQAWLGTARSTFGATTWLHMVVPFGGFERANLVAGVNAYKAANPSDAKVDLLDLGTDAQLAGPLGTPTSESYDGIHPNQVTQAAKGNALATAIQSAETAPAAPVITTPVAAYGFSGHRFSFGAKH